MADVDDDDDRDGGDEVGGSQMVKANNKRWTAVATMSWQIEAFLIKEQLAFVDS